MSKKTCIFFIISLALIMLTANILVHAPKATVTSAYPAYFVRKAKEKMVESLQYKTDTVVFGDSTAHGGLVPAELHDRVFNFATDGATVIEGYFALQYMIKQGKTPKNVVLIYLHTHYYFMDRNYWDQILGFESKLITRKDAESILKVDQSMGDEKMIKAYNPSAIHDQTSTVKIPLYYDIALGALQKIKPDFNLYQARLMDYYINFEKYYVQSRGVGDVHKSRQLVDFCTEKMLVFPPASSVGVGVVQYYLKAMIDLAQQHGIQIYVVGGPIPESCAALGNDPGKLNIEALKHFKALNLEYANRVAVPDRLMVNPEHADMDGGKYYSQQLKPFFEKIK